VTDAQAQVTRARTRRRDLELETQTLDAKIALVEERLYSGQVKNPKELTDLQNDSAALRRRRTALDDTLLEAMIALEDAEHSAKQAQDQLAMLQTQWQADQHELMNEQHQLEADIAALTEQRSQKMAEIAPEHLASYQRLRREHAGLAVARVEEGVCNACGEQLSDHMLTKARLSDDLSFCSNCGRILVID